MTVPRLALEVWRAIRIRIPADPLLQQRDELCRADYRVCRHAMMRVERAAVIHRPLADLDIGEADVDPCGCLRHRVDHGAGGDIAHMGRPFEVGDIGREHHIGAVVTLLRRHAEIERMVARKIEPGIAVPNRRTQGFSDRDDMRPQGGLAAKSAMTTGRSAAANASAAFASAPGSGDGAAGIRAASYGGSGTS
jgi:hypothetical protein